MHIEISECFLYAPMNMLLLRLLKYTQDNTERQSKLCFLWNMELMSLVSMQEI